MINELKPLNDPVCEKLGHAWDNMRTIKVCHRCGEMVKK